ncbi:hypothetical protein CPB84DRAFT_1688127, partial [Gymnopilus junonius]
KSSQVYINDMKSSNGTFIDGKQLSSEGQESEPFELKGDDIDEFGIDIVGEDNEMVIHHKITACVICMFNEQGAHIDDSYDGNS